MADTALTEKEIGDRIVWLVYYYAAIMIPRSDRQRSLAIYLHDNLHFVWIALELKGHAFEFSVELRILKRSMEGNKKKTNFIGCLLEIFFDSFSFLVRWEVLS